jgi:hypothetical protein
MTIPPIKPVYGVYDFEGQVVLPPGPQPPLPLIEGSMYASGGFVYVWHDGAWVEIGAGGGGEGGFYVHTQAILAATWTVTHNLARHPAVNTEDAGGSLIYGTINHVSDDTLTVTFQRSATGKAYCS